MDVSTQLSQRQSPERTTSDGSSMAYPNLWGLGVDRTEDECLEAALATTVA